MLGVVQGIHLFSVKRWKGCQLAHLRDDNTLLAMHFLLCSAQQHLSSEHIVVVSVIAALLKHLFVIGRTGNSGVTAHQTSSELGECTGSTVVET